MADFVKIAKKTEIPEDTGYLVEVGGKEIALFKVQGKVYAIDAICPHQGGPLHEGALEGALVTCPWHGWQFDVTTGVYTLNDAIRQTTYPVKEEGDDIYIQVDV